MHTPTPAGCLWREEITVWFSGRWRILFKMLGKKKCCPHSPLCAAVKPDRPCSRDARFSRTRQRVGSVKEISSRHTGLWWETFLFLTHVQRAQKKSWKKTRGKEPKRQSLVKCAAENVSGERPPIWNNRKDMLGCQLLQGGLSLLLEDQSGFTLAGVLHHLHLHLFTGKQPEWVQQILWDTRGHN